MYKQKNFGVELVSLNDNEFIESIIRIFQPFVDNITISIGDKSWFGNIPNNGEVEKIVVGLEKGKLHPKEVKMDLAQQIVEIYHGKKEGESAREQFVNTFSNKEMPEDIPVVKTKKGALLIDILVSEHIVESKTEFRRLLSAGAIRKDGDEKLADPELIINEDILLRVGKHRFVSVVVE